jgi:hypothetical protein
MNVIIGICVAVLAIADNNIDAGRLVPEYPAEPVLEYTPQPNLYLVAFVPLVIAAVLDPIGPAFCAAAITLPAIAIATPTLALDDDCR